MHSWTKSSLVIKLGDIIKLQAGIQAIVNQMALLILPSKKENDVNCLLGFKESHSVVVFDNESQDL